MATKPFVDSMEATVTTATEKTTAALAQAGNHFPPVADWKSPTQLDDEQLAALVADGAVKLAVFSEALKPYYFNLRERFHGKPKTARIYGCLTWGEYCEKVLDRTRRAMNYFIAGGNPGNEKAKQERARKKEAGTMPENGGLTGLQADVVTALVSQGFQKKNVVSAMVSAEGDDFNTLFKSALAHLTGSKPTVQKRDALPAEPPQPPPIEGDPVPEPEPSTLEELRQRILRMADTLEIKKALEKLLADLVKPLLEHHPYRTVHTVIVRVERMEKRRVVVGDWVEYTGQSQERLREQIGNDRPSLGRVVGEDQLGRPRIRWYNGATWLKPYSLFHDPTPEFGFRVLFDWQAAEGHPKAFGTYPSDPQPPNQPHPAKPSVATTDAANDEAEAIQVREAEEAPKPKTKRKAEPKPKPQESPADITETTTNGYYAKLNRKPKNATETAQPWEIYLNVNGAKPVFCCRESSKQDAEAQMSKLDRRVEEHIASLPKNEPAEAAAM